MKLRVLSIVILMLALTRYASTKNPFNGCLYLQDKKCEECYERKALPDGQGCEELQPKTDKCMLYAYNKYLKTNQCQTCKLGFAEENDSSSGVSTLVCVPGTIKNCAVEGVQNKVHHCSACTNGLYPLSTPKARFSKCGKVLDPVPHCLWGTIGSGEKPGCSRCEKGYVLDQGSGACQVGGNDGCLVENQGACVACDVFDGYSIGPDGKCFRTENFD